MDICLSCQLLMQEVFDTFGTLSGQNKIKICHHIMALYLLLPKTVPANGTAKAN